MTGASALDPFNAAKARFELVRELLRHEDGLVNNRVTWLLVLQGFLVAAFVNDAALYDKCTDHRCSLAVAMGLYLIAALGVYSGLTTANIVAVSTRHTGSLRDWWRASPLADEFPPISAAWPWKRRYFDVFSTTRLPLAFAAAWTLVVIVLVVSSALGSGMVSAIAAGAASAIVACGLAGIAMKERQDGLKDSVQMSQEGRPNRSPPTAQR